MKYTVRIVRIFMCAIVSLYTVYVCGHVGYSAYMRSMRITVQGDASYGYVRGNFIENAGGFAAFGLLLLALGALSVFLLFRASRRAAVGSALCAIIGAILGGQLNTQLSEYMFARYQLSMLNLSMEQALAFKPLLARMCIHAAVLYVVLYFILVYCQRKEETR
jgi:hypothetical protein